MKLASVRIYLRGPDICPKGSSSSSNLVTQEPSGRPSGRPGAIWSPIRSPEHLVAHQVAGASGRQSGRGKSIQLKYSHEIYVSTKCYSALSEEKITLRVPFIAKG